MTNLPVPVTESALPVPVTDDETKFLESFNKTRLPAATSWDHSTPKGRTLLLKCFTSPDHDLQSVEGEILTVHEIAVLRDVGKSGPDGETAEKWKACLIHGDSLILRFASPSALDCLRKIVTSLGGMSKISYPIQIAVKSRKGDAPGPYYILELVEDEA